VAKVILEIRAQIESLKKDLEKTQTQLSQMQKNAKTTGTVMSGGFTQVEHILKRVGSIFATMFTIGAVTAFAKKMIDLRKEWEKQTAVLKTLTGSQIEAEGAMQMLKKIADMSLSSLDEVTDAYIRMVNAGIKPSLTQMKKMADLATASGRTFGQLAEAIFDASNQQTRGLKDFGITSKIEGDKIKMSFKGMTETMSLTSQAIADFVIKAGGMEGIAGASEGVEKTMYGMFDEIGDKWETLMLNMGQQTEGLVFTVVSKLEKLIDFLNNIWHIPQVFDQSKEAVDKFTASLEGLSDADKTFKINERIVALQKVAINQDKEVIKIEGEAKEIEHTFMGEKYQAHVQDRNNAMDRAEMARTEIKLLTEYSEKLGQKVVPEQKEQVSVVQMYNDELTRLKNLQSKALNIEEWKNYEQQILSLQSTIKEVLTATPDIVLEPLRSIGVEFESQFTKIPTEQEVVLRAMGDLNARYNKAQDEAQALRVKKFSLTEAEKLDIAAQGLQASSQLVDMYSQYQQQKMDEELKNAGDNEAKKEQIRRKYARKQQQISVVQAIIGVAQSVVNALQTQPFIPAGLAASILAGVIGAGQIALIKSQKFAKGGYEVLKGKRHYQGGIRVPIGEAEDGEGHAIFTRTATEKYGKFLPEFVKSINEGKPLLPVDMKHTVSLDKSKQLEEIRKLLASEKEEIYYVDGHKIIKYKGSTIHVN
jgi:hypothetical protein